MQHQEKKLPGFLEDNQGVLWYKGRICVPNVMELKDKRIHEATSLFIPFI
jgi:hypothetical protein